MAYILEPENGRTEESIRAGVTHLLSVSTLQTPMDDHQFSGDQNEVPNKAYDLRVVVVLHLVKFLPILKTQFIFKDKEDLLTHTLSNHSFNQTQRKPKPELQEISVIASEAFSIFIT